jgi:polyhydroxyalkanoate synthesis regulator phasin
MKEDLKNIFLMGLGAMSMTSEKAKDLKDELLKKGNDLYESGKVANEELKHTLQDKIKDNVTVVVKNEVTKEDIKKAIKSMSNEDKKEIADLLKEKKNK